MKNLKNITNESLKTLIIISLSLYIVGTGIANTIKAESYAKEIEILKSKNEVFKEAGKQVYITNKKQQEAVDLLIKQLKEMQSRKIVKIY